MRKLFIFNFDIHASSGGIEDLVCVLPAEGNVGDDGFILPLVLASHIARERGDIVQVVHFSAEGVPAVVEKWYIYSVFNAPRILATSEPGSVVELADGCVTKRDGVENNFHERLMLR